MLKITLTAITVIAILFPFHCEGDDNSEPVPEIVLNEVTEKTKRKRMPSHNYITIVVEDYQITITNFNSHECLELTFSNENEGSYSYTFTSHCPSFSVYIPSGFYIIDGIAEDGTEYKGTMTIY